MKYLFFPIFLFSFYSCNEKSPAAKKATSDTVTPKRAPCSEVLARQWELREPQRKSLSTLGDLHSEAEYIEQGIAKDACSMSAAQTVCMASTKDAEGKSCGLGEEFLHRLPHLVKYSTANLIPHREAGGYDAELSAKSKKEILSKLIGSWKNNPAHTKSAFIQFPSHGHTQWDITKEGKMYASGDAIGTKELQLEIQGKSRVRLQVPHGEYEYNLFAWRDQLFLSGEGKGGHTQGIGNRQDFALDYVAPDSAPMQPQSYFIVVKKDWCAALSFSGIERSATCSFKEESESAPERFVVSFQPLGKKKMIDAEYLIIDEHFIDERFQPPFGLRLLRTPQTNQ